MLPGVLAHGTWIDDLVIPVVVAAVSGLSVLRASAGVRGASGACPYCGAPAVEEVVDVPGDGTGDAPRIARCGRCGFRLGARLPASEAAAAAPGEGAS